MSGDIAQEQAEIVLPLSVVSKIDLARLVNEVEVIDSNQTTARVHEAVGLRRHTRVQTSESLADLLRSNAIDIANDQQRSELIQRLRTLKDKVPIIHITFSTPADIESLRQLAEWLRANVHPQVLVSAGLQPALVAGVAVRTPNHIHDLSLRAHLKSQRGALKDTLRKLRGDAHHV